MERTRTAEEIRKRIKQERASQKEWWDFWNSCDYDYTADHSHYDIRKVCFEHIHKHEARIGVLYWMLHE
jgi:UDP-2,3-diacylglucosamine pyrophosphatase LpxH